MKRITIGRNPECDLNISEAFPNVSNEHADIQMENGVLTYIDHSTNGTVINGQNIHHSKKIINQGDKIILAQTYELCWNEIEKFFPSLYRATERFDGSQIDNNRKTELFDGAQIDFASKATERLDNSSMQSFNNEKKIERIKSSNDDSMVRGQVNEYSQAEIEEIIERWHTGAFLSSWLWAVSNRIYWPLLILFISLIPYIGQVASLFLCTYMGLNGYKLAWKNNSDHDFKKFISSQKKWTGIGIIVFIVCTAVQCASIYYILNLY